MMLNSIEMKDSGIEWIGEIPKGWEIKKIKYVSRVHSGSTPKSSVDEYWNGDINWYTPHDLGLVNLPKYLDNSKRQITRKGLQNCGCELASGGSLVLTTRAPVGNISISNEDFTTNQGCKTLVPIEIIKTDFLYFFILIQKKTLNSISNGTTFLELSTYSLNNFVVTLPPLSEQKKISNYLDRKTQQIDNLNEKMERKIELLKEQRSSLINQCVTKGLDPNVEMKDSGVEWIGHIPKHWEKKKITYLTDFIGSGTTPKSYVEKYYENGKVPWLITGDLNDNYILKTEKYISSIAIQDYPNLKQYPSGTISIAMYGATIGKLGHLKISATVNQANCMMIFSKENQPQYWFYVLLAIRKHIISLADGGGQPNINQDLIKSLRLYKPPLDEQNNIACYLDKKTEQIDQLVKKNQKKIKILKEYRESLISSVVTGKLRVTEDMI